MSTLPCIACLHTANSNVAVFEAAAAGLAVSLRHAVRAELLLEAEAAGCLTTDIALRTKSALGTLANGADGVLLTCSTLGPAADAVIVDGGILCPVVRVDTALAQMAVREAGAGRLVVLYAVATTRAPTQALFESVSGADPARISYQIVEGAWAQFRGGDIDGYCASIAAAADAAYEDGAVAVALAQASMSGAAPLARRGRPLTSPAAGMAAMLQRIAERKT